MPYALPIMHKIAFTTARTKKWNDGHHRTVVKPDANYTRVYVCNVVGSTKDGGNKTEYWEKSMKAVTPRGPGPSLTNQDCNFLGCPKKADVGGHVRVFKGPRSGKIDGWFIMPMCSSCNNDRSLDCRCDENSSNHDCCNPKSKCKNEKHALIKNYKLVFRCMVLDIL